MKGILNFGIIGFGLFGEKSLLPGFRDSKLADLVAITKQNQDEAVNLAVKYRIKYPYAYSNKQKLLKNEDIDAVFVATPNSFHMRDTIDALKAGKHVIVEKPMAMNANQCERMIKVAKENDRKLMVAHCMRYNSTVNYVKSVIESGEMGKLITGTCDFLSDGSKSQRQWKFDKKLAGGGPSFDLGVHLIDTLRYITELEIKESLCIRRPENISENEIELLATFLLDFEQDFVGKVTSSFIGPRKTFLEIYGENGYIRAFDWNVNDTDVRVESEINGKFNAIKVHNIDMYALEIDDFCRSIIDNTDVLIPGEEGLKNQRIIDLINY